MTTATPKHSIGDLVWVRTPGCVEECKVLSRYISDNGAIVYRLSSGSCENEGDVYYTRGEAEAVKSVEEATKSPQELF